MLNAMGRDEGPYTLDVLPPELLAYIFTFAWPKRRFAHQIPYEVQLSHVCRKWRTVALATSILWTRISIYSPASMKWIPSYLQRSGSRLPLSLLIDVYRWDNHRIGLIVRQTRTTLAAPLFSQLEPHMERIRHLSIMCYHEFTAIDFQSIFATTSAANLESINVQFDQRLLTTILQIPPPKIFIGGTPKLQFPNLQTITTLFLNLNESSMTLLYPEFVEVLTAPTALHHLSITGSSTSLLSSWPFHRMGPDPGFHLTHLKSLRIIDSNLLAVKMLLSVSVPQVESLWLNCSFDQFHSFFDSQQIQVPLSAILTIPEYNLNWIVKLSQVFPNITHLHLPHVNFFHIDLLVTALSNWNEYNQFSIALASVLEERELSAHPIKSLIMDRDFRKMLEERFLIYLIWWTYREPWWNNQIGNPFEHELS
ncbi:hypothetical protein BJ912DRAFT_1010373 [Pholiota molesta]|nr:hypothetical protein BJ912DRAFT_1010373 [Pholiota molesta]